MLSSVLNSSRAVEVNIAIIRTFVSLRKLLRDQGLEDRILALESKYDQKFKVVFDALRELMAPKVGDRRQIKGLSD